MNWIKKLFAGLRRKPTLTAQELEQRIPEAVTMGEQLKLFNGWRIKRMSEETGLNYKSIHNLARAYKISTIELIDYYCYFGNIPDASHKKIIQHFGVANIIAEAETTVEKLTLIK